MNCAVNRSDNSSTKDREEVDRSTSARYQNLSFDNMQDLQRRGKFCDITLKVGGRNYFAHRVVLAAASQHFADILDGEENQLAVVDFNGVSPALFKIILEYMYSGNSAIITDENVADLLVASKILRIGTLEAACSEVLPFVLTASNWWRIKAIAGEQQCEEVYQECQAYASQHFQEIAQSEAFLELPLVEVKGFVADRGVAVASVHDMYSAVLRWVKQDLDKRRHNLFELMQDVKFPLMEKTFFMKFVNREPLMRADLGCANLLLETNDYHAGMEQPASASTTAPREHYFKKEVVPYIFATGGWEIRDPISDCEVYNPRTNDWHAIASMQSCRSAHAVISFGSLLYAFGGWDGEQELRTVEYYDPMNDAWAWTTPLPHERLGHGICALNGLIYICGGINMKNYALSTVEQFDPSTGLYKPCAAMNTKRAYFKMAATGDSIYAIAGENTRYLDSVERFDPREGRWTLAPALSKQRWGLGVTAFNGYIYCTGGLSDGGFELSGERFDIRRNAWEPIPDMLYGRCGHELVALDSCVYAISGWNANSVEKFDPDTNRWVEMPSMLHRRRWLGASAMECIQINHR